MSVKTVEATVGTTDFDLDASLASILRNGADHVSRAGIVIGSIALLCLLALAAVAISYQRRRHTGDPTLNPVSTWDELPGFVNRLSEQHWVFFASHHEI